MLHYIWYWMHTLDVYLYSVLWVVQIYLVLGCTLDIKTYLVVGLYTRCSHLVLGYTSYFSTPFAL
jgi:hypothetical protein